MVDRTSGVPVYRQVADDIRAKIESGQYPAGDALPSEPVLMEEYGVSRPTLREAVKVLRGEGRLFVEHGRGMFVRPPATLRRLARNRLTRAARATDTGAFRADAASAGFTSTSATTIRFELADDRTAELLHIERGAELTIRDRVMKADGMVVQLAVSSFPRSVTRGTAVEQMDTGPGGAYARLEEAGHTLTRFEETVGTRMPTPEERTKLGLSDGVPVFTLTRIAFEVSGPVEVNDMVMSGSAYQLVYDWPAE
ncbi:MAG TPA: GntR family transcriptional regulator [Pseudonocardiaceae bacterium]|nr:GntR family transcriptional regulator [Pseudonocardiaceae bacterium]